MKKIFLSTFIFISLVGNVFAADTPQKACTKYKATASKEYGDYCSNIAFCDAYNPTKSSKNPLKIDQIPFVPLADANTIKKIQEDSKENWTFSNNDKALFSVQDGYGALYEDFLMKILGEKYVPKSFGTKPLDQARFVYTQTQNAIYNCVVLQTKYKIGTKIISLMDSKGDSNVISKLNQLNENINSEITKKGCNKPGAENKFPYRDILLDNITYNYCNYRYYLNYLSNFPEDNILDGSFTNKVQRPGEDRMNSSQIVKYSQKQSQAVSTEAIHAKQVYNMSISTFSEFENTYGTHVLLTLIYDDYSNLRTNLGKLLNPISQLAYKIPQAQK